MDRSETTIDTIPLSPGQGYCSCGDVGEVLHSTSFGCMALELQKASEAAVKMNMALRTYYYPTIEDPYAFIHIGPIA